MECLIILYRLYAESILTAWRSDLPPVFFVVVVVVVFFLGGGVIVKTCRRKEMPPLFYFTCKHSAPSSSIWNIFLITYFRTGIAGP